MKCIGKENFPKNNPYVVASNHQSYVDGVLIIDYLPKGHFKWMCCLAGADLETNHGKLGRLIMRVGRGIAVDRYGNPVRGLIKAKKEVELGNICFVFPEGTRTATGKLGELKDGACYLAIKAGTPLVPVYIAGAYQVWSRLTCSFCHQCHKRMFLMSRLTTQRGNCISAITDWLSLNMSFSRP